MTIPAFPKPGELFIARERLVPREALGNPCVCTTRAQGYVHAVDAAGNLRIFARSAWAFTHSHPKTETINDGSEKSGGQELHADDSAAIA